MLIRLAPIILAAAAAPGSLAFVASPPSHFATSNSVRQQTFFAVASLDTTEKDTETTNDGAEINALMAEAQALEAEAAALELEADALEEQAQKMNSMFFMGDAESVALEKLEVADVMQKEQAEAFEEVVLEQETPMEVMVEEEMAKVAAAAAMAAEAQEAVAAALEATPTMPAVEKLEQTVQSVAAANGIKTMSLRERLNQMNGEPVAQMNNSNAAIQTSNDAPKKSTSIKELMNEPVQMNSGSNSNSNSNVKSNAAPQNNNNNGGTKKKMSLRELALQTGNK